MKTRKSDEEHTTPFGVITAWVDVEWCRLSWLNAARAICDAIQIGM